MAFISYDAIGNFQQGIKTGNLESQQMDKENISFLEIYVRLTWPKIYKLQLCCYWDKGFPFLFKQPNARAQIVYLHDHLYTWQNFAMPYGSFQPKRARSIYIPTILLSVHMKCLKKTNFVIWLISVLFQSQYGKYDFYKHAPFYNYKKDRNSV